MTRLDPDLFDERALGLVRRLHAELDGERRRLLAARPARRRRLGFLDETRPIREDDWQIAPVPPALRDRRVEITGPTTPKMVINALNSGARCFMADFEDANSPTWQNMTGGQRTLRDAIRGTLEHEEAGRSYRLGPDPAVLIVRPRGLHLPERHLDGIAGCWMDFGLYVAHNAHALLERGWGPFLYLPKLESHLEARLWRRAFEIAEEELRLDRGTIRATVLIETVPAAFEMDEILFELRDHAAGLNAGRWDYLFSMIKCFRDDPAFVLPDRNAVTMTVPFMRAYTERLVAVCHRRGAHAMGGMSAVIPSRRDEAANRRAFDAVAADKRREAGAGYDGTWVAHPDSVPVALAEFDRVLAERPHQLERRRDDVDVGVADLLAVPATPGAATEAGLHSDVDVGIQYISSWLRGNGAAAIGGLMEDAATAEIARSQVWQWIRHGIVLDSGRPVTADLVRAVATEELARIREEIADDEWFETQGRPDSSRALFERVALSEDFEDFLTLPAYAELLRIHG
ncbi:MAG TPA: malate synthase A [Solirubrobacteraceae bacterium]|nr:malate synthase A [Solirubrobacteraceae bacterium]